MGPRVGTKVELDSGPFRLRAKKMDPDTNPFTHWNLNKNSNSITNMYGLPSNRWIENHLHPSVVIEVLEWSESGDICLKYLSERKERTPSVYFFYSRRKLHPHWGNSSNRWAAKPRPHLSLNGFLSNPLQPHWRTPTSWFCSDWDDTSCLIFCLFDRGLINPTSPKSSTIGYFWPSSSFFPFFFIYNIQVFFSDPFAEIVVFSPAGKFMVMATKISALPSYPENIVLLPSKGLRARFVAVGCLQPTSIGYCRRLHPYLCLFQVAMPPSINSSR